MPKPTKVRIVDLESGKEVYRNDNATGFALADGQYLRVHVHTGDTSAESIAMKQGWIVYLEEYDA